MMKEHHDVPLSAKKGRTRRVVAADAALCAHGNTLILGPDSQTCPALNRIQGERRSQMITQKNTASVGDPIAQRRTHQAFT